MSLSQTWERLKGGVVWVCGKLFTVFVSFCQQLVDGCVFLPQCGYSPFPHPREESRGRNIGDINLTFFVSFHMCIIYT